MICYHFYPDCLSLETLQCCGDLMNSQTLIVDWESQDSYRKHTPAKFYSSPLKIYHLERKVVFQQSIFQGRTVKLWAVYKRHAAISPCFRPTDEHGSNSNSIPPTRLGTNFRTGMIAGGLCCFVNCH